MLKKYADISDYCYLGGTPESRLSQFERLTLVGGPELGKASSWVKRNFNLTSALSTLELSEMEVMEEIYAYYTRPKFLKTPASFFQAPKEIPHITETPVHGFADGEVLDLNYRSAYQVQNPLCKEEYDAHESNKIAYARWWRHSSPPKATLIALHGLHMGDQKTNSLGLQPGLFYQAGMDVIVFELPFHGRRSGVQEKTRDSLSFPWSNIAQLNEAMGQTICDLRSLRQYLDSRQATPLGCLGMSLGGYCASLWAGLDPLDFCIPLVPLVGIADIVKDVLQCSEDSLNPNSVRMTQKLRELFYVHSPLSHSPKLSPESVLIVAAEDDTLIPSGQAWTLRSHFGRGKLMWIQGGHLGHFSSEEVFSSILDFLNIRGFAES